MVVSDTMAAQLVIKAQMMEMRRRGKPDVLLYHPDQRSQKRSRSCN